MTFNFFHLDEITRKYMVNEISVAINGGDIYYSKRFVKQDDERWPSLLSEAAESHNEHWLAYQIEANQMLKEVETAKKPLGGYTTKHIPDTAAETLAEGQFNRYYILGLCRRAKDESKITVQIYRAKEVSDPRPASELLIGQSRDVDTLISQLRPVKSSLGHELLQPNSGLSIRL